MKTEGIRHLSSPPQRHQERQRFNAYRRQNKQWHREPFTAQVASKGPFPEEFNAANFGAVEYRILNFAETVTDREIFPSPHDPSHRTIEFSFVYSKSAKEEANRARAKAAQEQHKESKPYAGEKMKDGRTVITDTPSRQDRSLEKAASEIGVSDKTVRQVAKVDATNDTELIGIRSPHSPAFAACRWPIH